MKHPKVSIIIPIYNAEKYLSECIESILNQTIEDWQLILVNDGSLDASSCICNEYAAKDARITFIEQKNQGVSVARNTGIEVADGDWITFVDADDMLAPYALETLNQIPIDVSVIVAGHTTEGGFSIQSCSGIKIAAFQMQKSILNFREFIKVNSQVKVINEYNCWSCWARFFKREIFANGDIRFKKGIKLGEDLLFCMQVYANCQNVWVNNSIIYYYRTNNASASRQFREDRIVNTIELCKNLSVLIPDGLDKQFSRFILDRLTACCHYYYTDTRSGLSSTEAASELRELCRLEPFAGAIKDCDFNNLACGKHNRLNIFVSVVCLKLEMYGLLLFLVRNILKKI